MCTHTRQVVGHRDSLQDWERNASLPRSHMAGARREIDLYGWTGLFAIWEVWLTHEAASQYTLEGREEAQIGRGEKKNLCLNFFSLCLQLWIVISSYVLGWPKSSFEFSHKMLWKSPNIVFGQPSISNHHVYTNVIQIYLSVILWSAWGWGNLFVMTAKGNLGCR